MRTFQEIKDHYDFTELDIDLLRSLLPVVEPQADRLVTDFYNLLLQIPDTAKYVPDEGRVAQLQVKHRAWLLALFTGPFDERYYQRLHRIGHAHVRIGLSAHFVYVGMNFLRLQLQRLIDAEVEPRQREGAHRAVEKILDLNLDVIARTYHEEEMRRVFLSLKLDTYLIRFARRFTFGLNLLLLVGLLALSLGVVVVLGIDISTIFRGSPGQGLVAALGSLLVLWMMIELLEAEIDRLQGGEFKLHLFIGVALVAFIRKVLVATMAHEALQTEILYLAGILVLGVIFWLVARTEPQRPR
jgi:uncharacterized membrane protein (DUF373 family)/hemoglobin-like flavoprotein